MQLTAVQIQLVKNSWKSLRILKPEVIADLFYTKLFTENPRLRKMFPADMQLQYKKLMDMLTSIITRLDNLDELSDDIAAMAQRHAGYGAKPHHYNQVGNALLWTLQQGLAQTWTAEMAAAWRACYSALVETMENAIKGSNLKGKGK